MKGLELAKAYYESCAKELLEREFSSVLPYLAIGLAGSGSECYGFDDEISRDHDFEPGFCIFLPSEKVVDRKTAFLLERAYAKLPREFMGFHRSRLDPVGGSRHGVIRTEDFFREKLGCPDGRLSLREWLTLPEYALLEATNGAVFSDPWGEFSSIRQRLSYFPEDVRRKKLAGRLLLMGQSGQYNYGRCLARGDSAAAQLALFEFVQSALCCFYLLKRRYMPYYKWSFRGLRALSYPQKHLEALERLISCGNGEEEAKEKRQIIEDLCIAVAEELCSQGLIGHSSSEMERLAYTVNDTVGDNTLRTMHVLQGV